MNKALKPMVGMFVVLGSAGVHAQGIPVIDAANLVQTVQQVINDITKINNQVQQITQLQAHLSSINGMRNLGNVFNSPNVLLNEMSDEERDAYIAAYRANALAG